MKFKKMITYISVAAILLSFTACGKKEEFTANNAAEILPEIPVNVCSVCGSDAHPDGVCVNFHSNVGSQGFCSVCGAKDHLNNSCTFRNTRNLSAEAPVSVVRCAVCGDVRHISSEHPICTVCGSKGHIIHHKCPICRKNDHLDGDCPMCEYCRTEEHTTNEHKACSVCKKKHREADEYCPNRKTDKCAYCSSTSHTTANHPVCSLCQRQHAENESNCPFVEKKCDYCGGPHSNNDHPTCSVCNKKHSAPDSNCPNRRCDICKGKHATSDHPICGFCNGLHAEAASDCPYLAPEPEINTSSNTCPACGSEGYDPDNGCYNNPDCIYY